MQIKSLPREYTTMWKGFAILHVMCHNFFHWVPPFTGENEWDFDPERVMRLIKGLVEQPLECINLYFSFFSYGHTLFIFISGVGLALSMQNRDRSWGIFIIERLKKLYPLMITGFVFLFFYEIVFSGKFIGWYHCREFLYKLLFLHTFNITKGSALSLSGPWWFFGLIFQLYILFPLLFKIIKKYRIKAFVLICFISYVWIYISQYVYQPQAYILLLQHAPGHLPELAFGILIAISPSKKLPNVWVLLSLAVFITGCFFKFLYPFTFLSAVVFAFWILSKIFPFIINKAKRLKAILLHIGAISMILFAIHGPLRRLFIAVSGETFYGRLLALVLLIFTATALSIIGNKLYKWLIKRFDISFKRKTKV
ncbi:MAG: acyltransferase [Bacteroidales bacterium]|nr:acyltransferase [Bacteroidales bacterium]